ncbi:MAG TPA: hypothetical protein VFP69_17650 [Streptomyces sp.]|nr:hypothetical protein [Streptomyces sp.]
MEAVLDELYVTRPSEFVARREELAVAARTAGRAEDARRIHAARRPTTAAWAANLLLRSAPRESGQFLELGRELREAYRTLDAPGWRELSAQRRRVVSALSRETAGLAREAGLRLSAAVLQEVDSTLRAVLADPEAADRWATGRLVTALAPPSGLPSAAAPGSGGGAAGAPAPRAAQRRTRDELAERRRLREEELTRARQAAEASEARLGERLSEHADAEESLRRARTRHDEAEQQVTAAARHLDAAREEREQAAHERDAAEERSQSAADALTRARREAREAAKKAERLAGRSRRG